jgi:hypothetical protein
MGVLDDAIREHIELKRQHGASEQDLLRQEQEALGPARRETAVQDAPLEPEEDAAAEAAPDAAPTEIVPPTAGDDPVQAPVDVEPLPEEPPEDEIPEQIADLEDEPAQPGGEEDVLEETPEFLQETPEHDRLWFEQKPPRDFDFDE